MSRHASTAREALGLSQPGATGPVPQRGIGVIAPYDFALDREIWRWAPADVSLFVTRTPYLPMQVTVEMVESVGDSRDVRNSTLSVLAVEPLVVAYACTSGSFATGRAGERRIRDTIREAGAPAAVTTSGALVDALDHLGVRRLAVATPYVAEVTERLHAFLAEAGVEVVSSAHLGLLGEIWKVPYPQVVDLVSGADHDEADAVFVSCTNLPTYDVIAPLERLLGKPVLTANQVTMWAALRAAGADCDKCGQRLFEAAPAA